MVATLANSGQATRPNAMRVAGFSCALAIHVIVFGVLLVPITKPMMPSVIAPSADPVWIEMLVEDIKPVPPMPVPPTIVRSKPKPVATPVPLTAPAPVFQNTAVPEVVPATVDAPPTIDAGLPEAGTPVQVGRLSYVFAPPPTYPGIAVRRHWEGIVILRILVGEDGRPLMVEIERSSGRALLDDAARKQVLKRWIFSPAMREGQAVRAWGTVPVQFTINQT